MRVDRSRKPPIALISSALLLLVAAGIAIVPPGARQAQSAFPGANGRILFDSDRDSSRELYSMEADGSDQTDLTNSPAYERRGSWSPDGSKIVFQRNEVGYDEIFVMDADGSNVLQLTDFTGGPVVQHDCCPSWSPDGTQVLFSRWYSDDQQNDIFVMNADGSGQPTSRTARRTTSTPGGPLTE